MIANQRKFEGKCFNYGPRGGLPESFLVNISLSGLGGFNTRSQKTDVRRAEGTSWMREADNTRSQRNGDSINCRSTTTYDVAGTLITSAQRRQNDTQST